MRQEPDHGRRHGLTTERTTFQLDRLRPVGFIGQKLRFLYLQPKGSVGILWDSRHVGRFPDTAPDTDTKQIQLVRTTFLGKPQFYRVSALFSCSRFTHHTLVIVFINHSPEHGLCQRRYSA
jgi:hypothetical protein